MCKIKFVEVSQIMENGRAVGMQYRDNWMVVSNYKNIDEAFYNFKCVINTVVTDNQSIILCRDDVKRFCKAIQTNIGDCGSKKTIFGSLKEFLYNNYEVKRIILNPRTLEYYPQNKAFIVNKL
jgi:hypothetical protein